MEINIFIFRRDLRTVDNRALSTLIKETKAHNIFPVFIFNPEQIWAKNNSYFSNNAVQFMIESLRDLEKDIGINYYEGDDIQVLNDLHKKYKIGTIAFNKDYTPYAIRRDKKIADWCEQHGINLVMEEDYTLFKMGSILNGSGKPYQIFSAFYRSCLKHNVVRPLKQNDIRSSVVRDVKDFDKDRYYEHNPNIAVNGGRAEGLKRLKLKAKFKNYDKTRDYPALDSTTKLSAYIKFGCVSIREVYYAFKKNRGLVRELIWREFYATILYHFPHILGQSFKSKYNDIRWSGNREWFALWCEGNTGFPLVDAGMKQLNETGWMHNRVRMIVAMFLTKDLLIDWRWGEKYFATKLVDYDPASNNGGWQWSAGTGTDAQPYFRIFNPDLQIKKYDKDYEYIQRWNPQWRDIKPIVDHKKRSKVAIMAFKKKV